MGPISYNMFVNDMMFILDMYMYIDAKLEIKIH